jgi:hypothetical protein
MSALRYTQRGQVRGKNGPKTEQVHRKKKCEAGWSRDPGRKTFSCRHGCSPKCYWEFHPAIFSRFQERTVGITSLQMDQKEVPDRRISQGGRQKRVFIVRGTFHKAY